MKKRWKGFLAFAIALSLACLPVVTVSAEGYQEADAEEQQEIVAEEDLEVIEETEQEETAGEAYECDPPLSEDLSDQSESSLQAASANPAASASADAAALTASAGARSGRSSVAKLSMDEIRNLYEAVPGYENLYETAPIVSGANYAPAVLTEEARVTFLGWLNYYRTAAGLTTVTLSEEANRYTSYGALCMAMLNNNLTHDPPKPADMNDEDYRIAYAAASSSNLSYRFGYSENSIMEGTVSGQICDSSISNIFVVGHRRWLLDPRMLTTGVGAADNGGNYFTAVKVFAEGVSWDYYVNDYDFISWPASGKNLTETFPKDTPWSITLNPKKYEEPEETNVQITLKRINDGKTWTFDASNDSGYGPEKTHFFVDNEGYGIENCITFRPSYDDISAYVGIYEVTVTGIYDSSGNETSLSYTVEFAPLESDLSNYSVTVADPHLYTGQAIRPEVTVMAASTKLMEGTDYTVTYSNNVEPGTATATVKGIGNYSGTVELPFTIIKSGFITFDANGGTGAPDYVLVENGKAEIPLVAPSLDFKNFLGWAENPEAAEALYQPGDTVSTQTGKKLYAVWGEPYELTDGKTETLDLTVEGAAVWYRFTPEYSCNYEMVLGGNGRLALYIGSGRSIYTVGASGMHQNRALEKDTTILARVSYKESTMTGTMVFSMTVKHTSVTEIAAKDATCTEDGCTAQLSCSVCGTVFQHSEVIPAKGHTIVEDPATEATCTEPGKTAGSHCSVCGQIFTAQEEIPAKGHQFSAWTSEGENSHKHTCAACGLEEEASHLWSGAVIVREATEFEEGLRSYTCTVCGQVKEEVIPKKDHIHEYVDFVIDPTCTSQGYTSHKCEKCGDEYQDTFVPALGHDWDEGVITKEATAEEDGVLTYTCRRCQETKTEIIPRQVIHVESLTLEPAYAEMITSKSQDELSTLQLQVKILPENATNQNVKWASSNEDVAAVDQNGLVTAYTYGKAVITAVTEDGEKNASCQIQTRYYDVTGSADRTDPDYKYYFAPVYRAADSGITKGYDNVYFGPDENCLREQMITFLWRQAGQPEPKITSCPLRDAIKGKYYYKAILWAYENGITKGYSSGPHKGTFGVGLTVSREDTVTFLYRMAGKPAYKTTKSFTDVEKGKYYYNAILWAAQNKITNGYADGSFGVGKDVLRKDIVTFLYRYENL